MVSNIPNTRKNSVMNPVFHHSASITTKLPLVPQDVIDWRLCKIKVVDRWVPGEDILDFHQFSSCYVLTCGVGGEGRKGRREKKR